MRYDDIDPMDIDPDTGRPYEGYSSPSIDTSFHDAEMAVDLPPPTAAQYAEAIMNDLSLWHDANVKAVQGWVERIMARGAIPEEE